MSPINLSEALKPYERKWVALEKGSFKVVAHGQSLSAVQAEARQKGCENPVFTFVPSFDSYFAS